MDLSTITISTAIWGAVTGTAGVLISLFSLLVSYLNFKRDRADVRLDFQKDRQLIGQLLHGFKPHTNYICLSVLNKGRRTVTIEKAGATFLKEKGGLIFSDSMIFGSRELREGKRIDFLTEQEGLNLDDINSFEAYDSVGNVYRKHYASWYRSFYYWLLDKLYIRRKQLISEVRKAHK